MVRVKFLLFALVALALVPAQLVLLTPVLSEQTVRQAEESMRALPYAVGQSLAERKAMVLQAAMAGASASEVVASMRPAPRQSGVSPSQLTTLREAALNAVDAQLAPSLLVGIVLEGGDGLYAVGEGEPSDDVAAVRLAPDAHSGAQVELDGASFWLAALPVSVPERNEVKVLGTVVVGLPLLPVDPIGPLAKQLELRAVALASQGKLLRGGELDEASAAELESALSVAEGQSTAVERGAAAALGPIQLPLFTSGDPLGGMAPLAIATRLPVGGTELEVVAVKSVQSGMQQVAAYQQMSLMGLGGLLLLSLLWLALMGSGKSEPAPSAVTPRPASAPPPRPAPAPIPESSAPAEASPDDFLFGHNPAPAPAPVFAPPAPDAEDDDKTHALGHSPLPFEAFPPSPNQAFPSAESEAPAEEPASPDPLGQEPPPSMPFGQPDPFGAPGEEYNPEATRVASIPHELLQATARGTDPAGAPLRQAAPLPSLNPVPAMTADPEEAHFQSVFRDFVTTREQCGEPADGLSFDKFAQKLRKNRDQMLQKYGCRTVRFQVYVKEGKAALKATPIRD